jgi:CubicO group peptidase (beta-lactamase class C family)
MKGRWIAFVLASIPVVAHADRMEEAAAYHRDFQSEGEGIVIATVAGGETTFAAAGHRRAGGPPVDADTLFQTGSITKVFTGILLADAVGKGKAALDDSIANHLPADLLAPDSPLHQVTLLDLATHTSGLPRLPTNFGKGSDPKDPYATYSVGRLYEYLKGFKEAGFQKRGETSYSNLGAGLLGHLLERLSGKPYEVLVRETIFEPLGMKSSFVQRRPGDLPADLAGRFATGHSGGEETPHWHSDVLCGASAIVATARDLATFASAHFSDATPPSLRRAMALASKQHRGEVGLGWFIGKEGLHHEGGTGGFRSELRLSLPDKTAKIRLMNGTGTAAEESRGEVGELSGYWQGTLDLGEAKLRLVLRVSKEGRVLLHSLDQGGQGLPADRTRYEDRTFRAVFGSLGARFEGTREGDRLTGTWSQNGERPLVLEYSSKVPVALKEALAKTITGDPTPLAGFWSGFLGGTAGLFVVFEIDSFDGVSEARFYSPDESSEPLPVTRLSFEGGQLLIESALIKAAFAAKLGDDGKLTGAWKQGPLPVPLTLVRSETMPKRE